MTARVTLYGKPGCHLCDEAKAVLRELQQEFAFELREIDITTDPALDHAWLEEIPVGYLDGRKIFNYRVDPALLRRQLRRQRGWLG